MNEKMVINICYEYIHHIIKYDEFIKGLEICNKNNKEITRFIEEISGVKNVEIITYNEDVLKQKTIIDNLISKLKLRYINENNKVKKTNINKEIFNLEKDKDNLNNSLNTWKMK